MSAGATVLRGFVRIYRAARAGRLPCCRYEPTCSAYALEALERFGAFRGGWMSVRRVLRCNPWGGFGFDPVPDAQPAVPTAA